MFWLRVYLFLMLFVSMGVVMAGSSVAWPDLKNIKFISGRAATEKDVSADRAVFVLKSGETAIGRPLSISIPQYAIHVDGDTSHQTPCILIQAEEAGGKKYGGCRSASDGSFMVGLINEFKLLGNNVPK